MQDSLQGPSFATSGFVVRPTYSVANHGHRRPPRQLGEVDSKWFLPAWLDSVSRGEIRERVFSCRMVLFLSFTGDAQQGANLVAPVRQTAPDRAARSLVPSSYFRNAQAVYVKRAQGSPFPGV